MDTKLKGKVVLVTGASGGIGSATARKVAAEGANLILHYRANKSNCAALARELEGSVECTLVGADLTREPDVRKMLNAGRKKFGRIDTLVANAGSWQSHDVPLHRMTLKQWARTQDVVLTSVFCASESF